MIAKLIFYVLATISVLFDVFLLFTTLANVQKLPYIKKAEIIIFIIAFIIMLTGTIIGFRQANYHSKYLMAILIFIISFVVTIISILIGLLYFNGPVKWN